MKFLVIYPVKIWVLREIRKNYLEDVEEELLMNDSGGGPMCPPIINKAGQAPPVHFD